MSPLCESYLPADQLDDRESFYPLHVRICSECLLVQLPAYVPGEDIFSDYAYFSSYSDSWVAHARRYAESMIDRLGLGSGQPRHGGRQQRRLPAAALRRTWHPGARHRAGGQRRRGRRAPRGSAPRSQFLGAETGAELAERYGKADLVAGNNVYAHIPDLVGFTAGLAALVKPDGMITLEFPHLLRLIERRQYDTIYHEHYHYLSLLTASPGAGHGRPAGRRRRRADHPRWLAPRLRPAGDRLPGEPAAAVKAVLDAEEAAGLHTVAGHAGFADDVFAIKRDLLSFLLEARAAGKRVVGYGAPGKGNTLLNHCGIREDLLAYTVDRSPHKQGMFLPGTHIPIHEPERIAADRPDYVLVLPWNLRTELSEQLVVRPRVGRQARLPDPDPGGRVMKVVLFCGGLGMRMREGVNDAPKPMAVIGDRPLLWHVMRYYAHFGHTEFILCLGYGARAVKEYFLHYDETLTNDFTLANGGTDVRMFATDISDWNITFIDTGRNTTVGERLHAGAQVRRGRADVPRQLRRHADRRPAAGDRRPLRRHRRRRVVARRAAGVVAPRRRARRDWTRHQRARVRRADAVGERRLLRPAPGDLRRTSAKARTWCRTPSIACSAKDVCSPSRTPASGGRSTRSRTAPRWRRCTSATAARGWCGIAERNGHHP